MSKTAKVAAGLFVFTLIAKILGFVRDIFIASKYGASRLNDIYILSQDIPVLIFSIVTAAIATGFIPIYCELRDQQSKESAYSFTTKLMTYVMAAAVGITVATYFAMPGIIRIVAFGYEGADFDMLVFATRLIMPNIIFVGGASVLRAFHQAEGRFKLASINTIMVNLIVIGFVLTSQPNSITWLLIGTLIGLSVDFFVQGIYALKVGLKPSKIKVAPETMKRFALLIFPIVVGTLVGQVNTVIDKTMGSTLPAGSITYLNGAFKLTTFANGIFAVTLGTVMFPIMATCLAGGNVPAFKKSFFKSMNMVLLFTVPITFMMVVFSHPIIQLLFERGAFTPLATEQTSYALVAYSIGLIALGAREVIVKAFFALQDTKTPMINGIVTVAINIGLNLVLIKPLAHVGLALSSSISASLTTVLLMVQLRNKVGTLNGKQIGMDFFKVLGASVIMAGATLGLNHWIQGWDVSLTMQSLYEIVIAGGVGIVIYAILIQLLHVEAWDSTKQKILEKLGRA